MSSILELDKMLEEKRKQQEEVPNVFDDNATISNDEIEKLRAETDENDNILMITERDAEGNQLTTSSLEEYTADLDTKIANLSDDPEKANEILRLVNNGDIKDTADKMKDQAKAEMMQALRSMAVDGENRPESDIDRINNDALKSIQKTLGITRLDSEDVAKRLKKMTTRDILKMLPQEFVDLYVSKEEQLKDLNAVRERLLATLAYLIVTGPEADYLNEYIDRENRLMLVSKELLKCRVDFSEILKDDRVMADMIREAYKYAPKDDTFWSKYIKSPNRVHNDFAQRAVLYQRYLEAYQKIAEQYKDDEAAMEIIQEELDDCSAKIEVYTNICNLNDIPNLWNILIDRYKNNKKMSIDFLYKECLSAIDKIRRCKQNLPFPGFDGKAKRPEMIFVSYMQSFVPMLTKYNEELSKAIESETKTLGEFEKLDQYGITEIHISGYEDNDVHTIYAMLLLILMGRVLKKFFSNTMTRFDAITLDSYFRIFCKIGTDIYIMQEFWDLMRGGIKDILDTWYLPEKKKYDDKKAKKMLKF